MAGREQSAWVTGRQQMKGKSWETQSDVHLCRSLSLKNLTAFKGQDIGRERRSAVHTGHLNMQEPAFACSKSAQEDRDGGGEDAADENQQGAVIAVWCSKVNFSDCGRGHAGERQT